jgi:predicted RNA binding protein YcfA (HicA-like mRNA interferase family)
MPSINPVPWKVLECIFIRFGCHFSRQKGSHRVYTKEGISRPIIIPAHGKELAVSVIMSNMRSAGLDRETYFMLLNECI